MTVIGTIIILMATRKQKILAALSGNRKTLRARFAVRKIGLFGSFARGEQRKSSDIDLLVEFEKPSFDNYMELKFFLEDLLKARVDVVMADSLKPRLKPYIEQEVIYAQGL